MLFATSTLKSNVRSDSLWQIFWPPLSSRPMARWIDSRFAVVLTVALTLGCQLRALAAAESNSASPFQIQRIHLPTAQSAMDANIRRLYEIEQAAWIWHPKMARDQEVVLVFRNEFSVAKPTTVLIHVSADQRYELTLNGQLISLGPDRGDLAHWSFASYQLQLPAGTHRLEAVVAWIGDHAPCAQVTHRGGFI
jgi:hypothetical protein